MATNYLTIVIGTNSNTVPQLNQLQADSTNATVEWNQLIDYLGRCSGGNEIITEMYVVTRTDDPAVATSGTSSTKTVYIGS